MSACKHPKLSAVDQLDELDALLEPLEANWRDIRARQRDLERPADLRADMRRDERAEVL